MRSWQYLLAALLLILCLAVSPASAADWVPPHDRSVVGVEWNASDPSPALRWIDVGGNTITPPDFNTHVVWGNVKKVLLTDDEVVIRDTNPRGDTLDMSGASGKVMTEIPKFYVASTNASTGQYRYYRWFISPDPAAGFTLHPAFVQRGGTERDNIYVGSYEATLRVLDDGTLALDSRSGEQPWTGYGGSQPLDGMFKIAFDGGTTAPAIGATVTGNTSGTAGQVVDLNVSSGSWAASDAAGFLVLKQTSGTFTNDEPLTVSGSQFAAADTPNGNAGIRATINDFEAAGEALGDGYGAMNVWTYSAIRMLHLVEYANWGSQETVGLGIVSKASGTGFAGEITGYNSVDTNVNEYGTGTGTGPAGYTPASYRTMTDLWGNSWEWVTGYTSTNSEYQIVKRNGTGSLSTHPLTAGSYESSEATPLGADGYVSGYWTSLFHEDLLQYQFIANSVTGGSQSTYGTDYQYSHNPGTIRVLLAGGYWDSGRAAGLGYLSARNAASYSVRNVGARLEFTGAATLNGAAPAAQYALNASAGNAPFAVAFTDTSTGTPGWWRWDFGDGNTSTDQSPVHTYTEPGTYTVTQTAYTLYGENTTTQTVEVRAPPVATFTQNATEGNAPLAVAFTDASTGNVTAWAWAFGDGNTSTDRNATHTYTEPGTYSVTLNASNAYGYNISAATAISVLAPPVADFSANATVIPAGSAVAFTDASTGNVTAWSWDFGDSQTSTDRNATHTYAAPGTYNVTLNASNPYGYNISTRTDYIDVGNPPAAGFTTNVTGGNAPLAVQFTDTTEHTPTSWAWDFGDGNTSTAQSPVHTYAAPGTYTVTLNASNPYGYDLSTQTDLVTVLAPPAAGFTQNVTEGNAPLAVAFTDASTGNVTAWAWDFGDSQTSTDRNATHTYAAPGTYSVTLNASNAFGFNLNSTTISVLDPPVANFSANATVIPTGSAVAFTDASTGNVTSWSWNFGDTQISTDRNATHTYAAPGLYSVTLTVSNAYGEDTETKAAHIDVGHPPAANFTPSATLGVVPAVITFTDTSANTPTAWLWDFGDGNNSTLQNPSHTYVTAGTYTVTLTATNAYGEDSETKIGLVAAYDPLVPGFTATPRTGYIPLTVAFTDTSTGFPTSWLWDFGDDTNSTQQNQSHTYTEPGFYTVTLTVTHAADEQTETKTAYITASHQFAAAFTQNTSYGMVPLAVQFTSTTDTSVATPTGYLWDFGDDTNSTQQNPSHTYTVPGYYTVSLTVYGVGTENTATHPSAVHAGILPTVAFTGTPATGTAPLTVQFTSTCSDTTSYLWDFGDGSTSTAQNPSHTYTTPGTYNVTLTGTNLYGSTVSTRADYVTATQVPPVAAFSASPLTGHAPVPVKFTDASTGTPTAWAWTFGDGTTSTLRNPTHIYRVAGTYSVTLTVTNDGGSDAETKTGYLTIYAAGDPGYTDRFPASDKVVTLDATGLGTQEAVLNGELAAATDTEVWFEYGTKPNSYGFKSVPVTAEPGSLIQTPIKRFPLIAGQTYYYRLACADGYGAEQTFTLPTLAPHPTTTYGIAADQFLYSFEDGDTMIQDMTEATWSPYVATLGALFFGLVIGAIFINLAMKGHSIAIPALLVMVIGGSLWAFVPPEFIIIAQAFVILGIGGLIYYIYTKRKL